MDVVSGEITVLLLSLQCNLLASGANDSEIYIWDLNNFSVPMTPGAKSQVKGLLCGQGPCSLEVLRPWTAT